VIITSAQNLTGEKQNEKNEEWYNQECREMIKAKRDVRLKCIQRNTSANQEECNRKRIAAARVCRRKKREALKRKGDAIVEHHTKNKSKKFYKRIQEITQEFKPSINVCRSEEGKILTENEDVQRRWKEYFESILTSNSDKTDSTTVYTAENEDIQPSYEEVTHVIQCLKKHKTAGTDQIVAEFLKKKAKPYGEESTTLST